MKNVLKLNLLMAIALSLFISCKGDKKSAAATETETKTITKAAPLTGDKLNVDTNGSTIFWKGTKPTGSHTGTIKLSEGSVSVDGGKITGGNFTIDMNTINCTDLDGDMKANLEAHLKGTEADKEDDFFNVAKFPTASFEITKVTELANTDRVNIAVYGNLTMKGITKEISFPAQAVISDDSVIVRSKSFKLNRTDWGIKYLSNSFFDNLKEKFIDDEIELTISLRAI